MRLKFLTGIKDNFTARLASRPDFSRRIGAALRIFRQDHVLQKSIAKRTFSRFFKPHDSDSELTFFQLAEYLVVPLQQRFKFLSILRREYEIVLVLCQNVPECHF